MIEILKTVLPLAAAIMMINTGIHAADAKGKKAKGAPVTDELIVYEPGNMPVIILVPHDGTIKPDGLPLRTKGTRDLNASPLARTICKQLSYTDAKGVKRQPYLVINLASRAVAEPNKSWEHNVKNSEWTDSQGRPTKPSARNRRIHTDFHACADHAVRSVQKQYGRGILIDLHGLGSSRKLDMYGYIARYSDLRTKKGNEPATDKDLAKAVRERSTIQYAASKKKTDRDVADLLRGHKSLASLVDDAYKKLYPKLKGSDGKARGRPATPSSRYPNPKGKDSPSHDKVYFNGAYDIRAHSSFQEGIKIDAIQIETASDARNNKTLRARFARCMAVALREFLRLHYDLDISPAK